MPQPELIVVERMSSQRRAAYVLLAILLLSLVGVTGFFVGNQDAINLRAEKSSLNKQIAQLTQQLAAANKQLVMLEQLSKVEQAANRQAGSSLDSHQLKIRELERELEFFRNIIAPEEAEKGLKISRFKWQRNDQGHLGWQLSLIQAGSQGATISGTATISIRVNKAGETETIQVKDANNRERHNYRFRYFQHLTGSLELEPEVQILSAEVKLLPSVKGQPIITEQFQWQTDEEKLANVE